MIKQAMVAVDLDGTMGVKGKVPAANKKTLENLKAQGILRVAATGRSMFSLQNSCFADLDFDYIVFSTGLGVWDCKHKKIIQEQHLQYEQLHQIKDIMLEHELDFGLHLALPENHRFLFHTTGRYNPDFISRLEIYQGFHFALKQNSRLPDKGSQFIAILPYPAEQQFQVLAGRLDDYSVIRATSPLDGRSIWLEVFPEGVCKSKAINWLTQKLGITPEQTLAVGNDYNDQDLLDWAGVKFVVGDSPAKLKNKYEQVDTCEQGGFAQAVNKWLGDS